MNSKWLLSGALLLLFSLSSYAQTEETDLNYDYYFLEGICSKTDGNIDRALGCFYKCIQIDEKSAAARYELSLLLMNNGDLDNALQLIREAVDLEPEQTWYRLGLIEVLRAKSMIPQACEVYEELILKDPDNKDYYLWEAQLYVSIENWKEANNVLKRFEKRFGVQEISSIQIAQNWQKMGNQKQYTATLFKLAEKFPEKGEYLAVIAGDYLDQGDEKAGIAILEKMVKIDPRNSELFFTLADYYLQKVDTVKAYKYFEKALFTKEVNSLRKAAEVYKWMVNRDNFKISENILLKYTNYLVDTYKEDPTMFSLRADLFKSMNRYEESNADLRYLLEKDPHNDAYWEQLLVNCYTLQDYPLLSSEAQTALKFIPTSSLPYLMLALPHLMNQEYDSAIPYLEKGVVFSEDNPALQADFYSYLGESYHAVDSVERCFEMYDKALKFNPYNDVVLNNYAYYLSLQGERLEEAERMSLLTLKNQPDNATYLDTYAWILYQRNNFTLARFYIKLAISKDETPSADVYDHAGDIFFRCGDSEEAIKMWQAALKQKPNNTEQILNKIANGLL